MMMLIAIGLRVMLMPILMSTDVAAVAETITGRNLVLEYRDRPLDTLGASEVDGSKLPASSGLARALNTLDRAR